MCSRALGSSLYYAHMTHDRARERRSRYSRERASERKRERAGWLAGWRTIRHVNAAAELVSAATGAPQEAIPPPFNAAAAARRASAVRARRFDDSTLLQVGPFDRRTSPTPRRSGEESR